MKSIYFSAFLDGQYFWGVPEGFEFCGEAAFLRLLENELGLTDEEENKDATYTNVEQMRQVLSTYVGRKEHSFFAESFKTDSFATSRKILAMRDELCLIGWDFLPQLPMPRRLEELVAIENLYLSQNYNILQNFADKFRRLRSILNESDGVAISQITIHEPFDFLPIYWQQVLKMLETKGVFLIQRIDEMPEKRERLLSRIQQKLVSQSFNAATEQAITDDSVLLIRCKRETDAAHYFAQIVKKNPLFRPLCLLPEHNRCLDEACVKAGLPAMGILSQSAARPSLQVLKLVSIFLWEPLDIAKVMEFLSLSIKPLQQDLSNKLASVLAESPGVGGDRWRATLGQFFKELEDDEVEKEVRFYYRFWFERRRRDNRRTVPTAEPIDLFNVLSRWARRLFDEQQGKNSALLVLSEQARRVAAILDIFVEPDISFLDLERVIRSVAEPMSVQARVAEVGHLPFVHQPSAIASRTERLLWWNFTSAEPKQFFDNWYPDEIKYLSEKSIILQKNALKNKIQQWQFQQLILHTEQQIIFVIPEMINGEPSLPHSLWVEIEFAAGKNLPHYTFDIQEPKDRLRLEKYFQQPDYQLINCKKDNSIEPFLEIQPRAKFINEDKETLTSLESLLYFPHQWLFRYAAKLQKSPILNIVEEQRLFGNLAHHFLSLLFSYKNMPVTESDIYEWINERKNSLLQCEAAVLLQYGMEPTQVNFLNRLKKAAWVLVNMIQSNGWQIVGTETDVVGSFNQKSIGARLDLVLQRADEFAIIDMKWGGRAYRSDLIKNEEDLQLLLYAELWKQNNICSSVHTAYFILKDAKMLARNKIAFRQAIELGKENNHEEAGVRILSKIKNTYQWRNEQIEKGKIEIRTSQNAKELERIYSGGLMFDLLEMKDGDAAFDDYKILIL